MTTSRRRPRTTKRKYVSEKITSSITLISALTMLWSSSSVISTQNSSLRIDDLSTVRWPGVEAFTSLVPHSFRVSRGALNRNIDSKFRSRIFHASTSLQGPTAPEKDIFPIRNGADPSISETEHTVTVNSLSEENHHNVEKSNPDQKIINHSEATTKTTTTPATRRAPRTAGLSKFHRSILSSTMDRQRFVTGRYPVVVNVQENPTRKWLKLGRDNNFATARMLVNGTALDRSLASYDRFQWLDDDERRELHDCYDMVSLELLAEVHCKKPAYLNVLPSYGAGSTSAARRLADDSSPGWDRWKRNSILFESLEENMWQKPMKDRLWVTGFSLTKQRGDVYCVDTESGYMEAINDVTQNSILWPNEVNSVPMQQLDGSENTDKSDSSSFFPHDSVKTKTMKEELEDALLISDGFLVPGRDKGGLHVVRNPGCSQSEWSICLTGENDDGWFYHRAVWVDLTGDGRKSILTARAKRPSILKNGRNRPSDTTASGASTETELVWLEHPKPDRIDEETGTPVDADGTVFDPFSALNTPWKTRVLDVGPDVMFAVADLDTDDDTVEVIASQFFSRKLSLYSIQRGPEPYVSFRRIIDDKCGAAFGAILANLDDRGSILAQNRRVVDAGSTVTTLRPGDAFSHLLVTSHECSLAESEASSSNSFFGTDGTEASDEITMETDDYGVVPDECSIDGGSLFSYRVPVGKDAWKTDPWIRTVVACGFQVKPQLSNAINPGAPGFCYTFYPKNDNSGLSGSPSWKRPLIAVAGDCAESAYIFRPVNVDQEADRSHRDSSARYALMTEIKCGATVGSVAIGYDDFLPADQESGYAKIYLPCYEKDKILVFAMGSGEYDSDESDDW